MLGRKLRREAGVHDGVDDDIGDESEMGGEMQINLYMVPPD